MEIASCSEDVSGIVNQARWGRVGWGGVGWGGIGWDGVEGLPDDVSRTSPHLDIPYR